MCGRVSPSIPFTLTTPLSVVTHVPVVHSVCAGDMSGSSSEEEEEEEETEVAEGGLEMLVAGKRLEEVRPHLFMPRHQFVPICPLLRPYLLLFSPSSPPPLPLLSLLSPSSLPPLSLLSSSSPSSFPSKACQTEEGLSNVAAAAEQFQPKGITLATTEVRTSMYCHSFRALSHFSILQAIESWVGPGNKAVVNISLYYAYKHEHA